MLRLLDGHPRLSVVADETYYFARILQSRVYGSAFRLTEFMISEALSNAFARYWYRRKVCGMYDAFAAIVSLIEESSATKYWVEKSPSNERFVDILEIQFSGRARYIHIIRDPRDVVASWLQRRPKAANQRSSQIIAICHQWAWSAYLAMVRAKSMPNRYRVIQFEQLVSSSETTMNDVANWIGIESCDSLTKATRRGKLQQINSSTPDNMPAGSVSSGPIGRHTDHLSVIEIALIERMLATQMSHFGYSTGTSESGSGQSREHKPGLFASLLHRWHTKKLQRKCRRTFENDY